LAIVEVSSTCGARKSCQRFGKGAILMAISSNSLDWDGRALAAKRNEWIVDIQPEVKSPEMQSFLEQNARHWLHWNDGQFPECLKNIRAQLRELLLQRTGVALVKCGPKCSPDEARLIELILGGAFGCNVTKTADKKERPLFALKAEMDPTAGGGYSGNGLRQNVIGFHTDGSGSTDRRVEILGLLCLCPARFGGQSRIANAQRAICSLPAATRHVLRKPVPRENPFTPGAQLEGMKVMPIFCEAERDGVGYLHFSYHPQRVRNGIAHDVERYGAVLGSLRLLDEALEQFSCEINLMSNEILFVNNCAIAHDRRAFIDDPWEKRFLERFWAGTFIKASTGESHVQRSFRACSGK
jgi:hypothetical protein